MGQSDNTVGEDRRQFTRVEFEAVVKLSQDGRSYDTELMDVSLNGVLVKTPSEYEIRSDQSCDISIRLSSDCVINMECTLVHSSSTYLGLHCTSIDMDSMVYLRRLIEINMDDPQASERVLSELLRRH